MVCKLNPLISCETKLVDYLDACENKERHLSIYSVSYSVTTSIIMSNALIIVVGVVSNILSVVGIVICNKYITEVDGFHFVVFLSFLHFAFTSVFTRIMMAVNIFSYQSAPLEGILPVAAGSLLSVAFMNLNLQHNSVGFYQV